jgi:hypothetical protein
MIEIRPIWNSNPPDPMHLRAEISTLLSIEQRIVAASSVYLNLARILADSEYVDELTSLMRSSQNDLVAGSEMARTGYFKQAYSLWRAWFEQSIFFLYFLEAPLHKSAWKVKAEISGDESPPYRLMLHELLADSGERHPFTLVYDARFTRLTEALKISSIPKAQRLIPKAGRILTALSQGVHGTYQPQSAQNLDALCAQIDTHCNRILVAAEEVFTTFWILLITDLVALPESVLVRLREGDTSITPLRDAGVDEAEAIAKLAPYFALAFPLLKTKHG